VNASELRDGVVWLRVEVLDQGCEGSDEAVMAQGWMRAFGPQAGPSAWFWSRGC
jgi:hypothetical protein